LAFIIALIVYPERTLADLSIRAT